MSRGDGRPVIPTLRDLIETRYEGSVDPEEIAHHAMWVHCARDGDVVPDLRSKRLVAAVLDALIAHDCLTAGSYPIGSARPTPEAYPVVPGATVTEGPPLVAYGRIDLGTAIADSFARGGPVVERPAPQPPGDMTGDGRFDSLRNLLVRGDQAGTTPDHEQPVDPDATQSIERVTDS